MPSIRIRYARLAAYLPPRSTMENGLAHTLVELAPRYLLFLCTVSEDGAGWVKIVFDHDASDEAIMFLMRHG